MKARATELEAQNRLYAPLLYAEQHAKQQECTEALRAGKKTIALFWGNRVGKTEWGAQTVAKALLGKLVDIFPGPCEVWSFCPSFDEQKDTTQKKLLAYIPEHEISDKIFLRKGILRELILKNKNKITFKSYEQGREKAQGAGKSLIWFDEEPPKDIWEECSVRQEAGITLRTLITMTAVKGMTWIYNDLYLKTDNPDVYISEAGWDDNPWLSQEQMDVMSRGLSEAALQTRRDGKFVKVVGLVCAWFSRNTHVVNIQEHAQKLYGIPELPLGDTYFGLDFGFSAPAAGLYVRIDKGFNFWIFDGFYRKGLTTPDTHKLLVQKEQGLGRVIRIADSAQASDIKQLNDLGAQVHGVKKETGTTKESWDEYRARLLHAQGAIQEATGYPKLFISDKLLDYDENGEPYNFLVKELETLRWEEVKTALGIEQRPIWGSQPKHAIDALSYICATITRPIARNTTPKPRVSLQNKFSPF